MSKAAHPDKRTKHGQFITLEGVEGAGKSSQIDCIRTLIESAGHEVITTREPGGTKLAEAIRALLLDGDDMPAMTELLLMFAARSSHVEERIRPAIESGQWVICDRFVDASYAYQGAGRGIDAQVVNALEGMTLKGLAPDLTLIFDLPVEVGFERTRLRGQQNRFDHEETAFMNRIRDAYKYRAAKHPERYRVIDASAPMKDVSALVEKEIAGLINNAK